ncbi:MAG: dihydroneopterin aldolase [Candidatus Marsarchaeota archaeon]|nr:dihydroneopterin aldolase [Candidatus Marsarchaeota archaeon]
MDRIFLDGIGVTASHGVLRQEKLTPQQFEIDISVFGDFHLAGEEDLLDYGVDYSELGELVVEVATSNSFNLIEALAEAIADRAMGFERVVEVEVTVRKMRPPVAFPLNHAGVTIRRSIG